MAYKSNYTGPQIDEAIRQVLTGEVVENNTTNEIGEGIKEPISSEAVFKELSNKGYTYEGVKIAGEGPHEVQGYTIFNGQYSQDKYVVVSNKSYKLEIDKTINISADGPSFSITYNKDVSGKGIITIEKQNSGDPDQTVFVVNTITTLPDVLIPGSIARKEDLNLYIADFTIEDLESLSVINPSIKLNARALISALNEKKTIGVRQNVTGMSMAIASAHKDTDSSFIHLSVISSNSTMYKVFIHCGSVEEPEIADTESGSISLGDVEVIPIENPYFAPFEMNAVVNTVEGYWSRIQKDYIMPLIEANKPLFIPDGLTGAVPASYLSTTQDGKTVIDIDIIYNKGLYHIHWVITDDTTLHLSQDTVSYTPFSDVYIVTEFTVDDIVEQAKSDRPTLTISRAFLDAAYRGVPIMVRVDPDEASHVPITVHRINNPNEDTAIRFRVQQENIEYQVSCFYNRALIGDDDVLVDATITSYNLVDWYTNNSSYPGYIANRTHYHNTLKNFLPGDRYSITDTEAIHDLNNYRLLLRGDLFKIQEGRFSIEKDGAYIEFVCARSESGNTVTWTINNANFSGFKKGESIKVVSKLGDYKPLDEFYLPDIAKGAYITEFDFKTAMSGKAIHITNELVEAVVNGRPIMIPFNIIFRDNQLITVTEASFNYLGEGIHLMLCCMYQGTYYQLELNSKSQAPLDITPILTSYTIPQNLKTINGESIIGNGDITTLTGIKNVFGQKISTIDNGVLTPTLGDFAGLSTKPYLSYVRDPITLGMYVRTSLTEPIKNDRTISFSGQQRFPNAEWELLFEVDSDTPIAISIDKSWIGSSTVIRCKENGITHSSLSRGYYRLKAITNYDFTECLVEIDRFN